MPKLAHRAGSRNLSPHGRAPELPREPGHEPEARLEPNLHWQNPCVENPTLGRVSPAGEGGQAPRRGNTRDSWHRIPWDVEETHLPAGISIPELPPPALPPNLRLFCPKNNTWDKRPHSQSPPKPPQCHPWPAAPGLCSTRCAAAGSSSQTSPAFAGEVFCSLARLILGLRQLQGRVLPGTPRIPWEDAAVGARCGHLFCEASRNVAHFWLLPSFFGRVFFSLSLSQQMGAAKLLQRL